MNCHYCQGEIKKVTGAKIYPHREDLYRKKYYLCTGCGAYVNCHDKNNTVANGELRKLRLIVHNTIDPLWRNGELSRNKMYKTIAYLLKLPREKAHVGMFNTKQFKKIIKIGKYGILFKARELQKTGEW